MTSSSGKPRVKLPRILTFDLLRGWFLVIIILDHLSYFPNGFSFITGDSRLFVTAAEGFFLVSGIVLGIVRGYKLIDAPFWSVTKKLWFRAFTLYVTSIVITLLSLFISWQFIGNDGVKSPIPPSSTPFGELLWNIITLREFYGWADYLRFYAIFLFISPLWMWLLRRGWWYIGIAVSFAIWAVAPRPVTELLQPLTWQLLFFIALTIGFYLPKIRDWKNELPKPTWKLINRSLMALFAVTLTLNVYAEFISPAFGDPISSAITAAHHAVTPTFFKNNLSLERLSLAFLWFYGFYMIVRRYEKQITRYLGWLLLPFGVNSLYVYSVHAFVIVTLHLFVNPQYGAPHVYLTSWDRIPEIPRNMALSVLAVGVVYLMVKTKFLMKVIPR
ncbi:MAG TPA: OpgC domain-containing protein [Candidatus Saccharimonadales bacterium]